jgi:hypothetical protein
LVYLESFATFRDWGLGEGARRRIGGVDPDLHADSFPNPKT